MNVVSAWSLAVRCKRQSGNEYKKFVRDKWGRNHEMLATKTNLTSKHLSIKKMLIKLLSRSINCDTDVFSVQFNKNFN